MLDKSTILRYYKRPEIQEALLANAKDKEVGTRYGDGFGKRPDILVYPRDVLELAKRGCTSFHISEETWTNPLSISSDLKRKELDQIRNGWDLILDIDCAILEYSKICADLIVQFLNYCGATDFSIKFSGNKGFHIGIPFEAFPQKIGETLTKDLFPEAPRKIAFYIKENIKEQLSSRILAFEDNDFSKVREKVNLPQEEIIREEKTELGTVKKLDVDAFLEIDTVLLSSRHLYRMPYSLHEKSGLASILVDPTKILEFEKPMANPDHVTNPTIFLKRDVEESARRLLSQSLDFEVKLEEESEGTKFEELGLSSPITNIFFPPCIKKISGGLEDGKKRAIFIMMNFLGKVGWKKEEIEVFLRDWNKKNPEALREVYIKGQMHSFIAGAKLPPNCDNEAYCKGINVCDPDSFCKKIKNPANYAIFKWKRSLYEEKSKEKEKEFAKKAKESRKKAKEERDQAKDLEGDKDTQDLPEAS